MNIPTFDLNEFEINEKKFSNNLGIAFQETGFVIIKNSGISKELVDNMYSSMYNFFNLQNEIKMQYHYKNVCGQYGYTPLGQEHAKESIIPDNKEFIQFKNNSPVIPYFDGITDIFKNFENCATKILSAIAIYLDLPINYFEDMLIDGESVLRCLHYPPTNNPDSIRASEHEDINLITLLVGASATGLQILTKNNEWIAITPPSDTIVVNIGDMLQRLTNGNLKSTTHRVISDIESINKSRYSMPFFMHPNSKTSLNCIKSCITNNNPKSYEDITAGTFLNQRLCEIGFSK